MVDNSELLKSFAQRAKRRLVGKSPVVNAKIKVITQTDDDFRNKVKDLLSTEEVVTNPLHYLMDEKVMKTLDEEAKERYLLSTLDKYIGLKNEFERMSEFSRNCL